MLCCELTLLTYSFLNVVSRTKFLYCCLFFIGVIDNDFTGTLKIILHNASSRSFKIEVGDRMAQLVIEKYFSGESEEVYSFTKESERGDRGMGSSGISAESINM